MIQDTQESPEGSNKMIKETEEGFMKTIRGSQYNWLKPKGGRNGRIKRVWNIWKLELPGEKKAYISGWIGWGTV